MISFNAHYFNRKCYTLNPETLNPGTLNPNTNPRVTFKPIFQLSYSV